MINFISNLPKNLLTGGMSAVNAASYGELSRIDQINYVGPINPPFVFSQKILSKALRAIRFRGNFAFFSEKRLRAIADEVRSKCSSGAKFDFFHGFTPWISTMPRRPYVAWGDCTFHDYIRIFHHSESFRAADIERIERAEAEWLMRASRVLFSTRWAAARAVGAYGLPAAQIGTTGIFGELPTDVGDTYAGANEFAFVATNFAAKGGHTVLSAFRALRDRHPDITLTVVGERPAGMSDGHGVKFVGFLRKENPSEYELYRRILCRIRALVHPTMGDISPLIIVEAGYFGCPVIASNRFAISELVDDRISGILLDEPSSRNVAEAMDWMLQNDARYRDMRLQARIKATGCHSKAAFGSNLRAMVAPLLMRDENSVSR